MAARFLNRVASIGATVGIGGFCLQECIYDGAFVFSLRVAFVCIFVASVHVAGERIKDVLHGS